MTKADLKNFGRAAHAAELSDYKKTNVGCVATYQGQVIGMGFNTNKTHPLQKHYNTFRGIYEGHGDVRHKAHAEIMCLNQIKDIDIKRNKVKLYIYRKRKDIPHGISRPCPACMAAIREFGIENIYYTTDDGFVHEVLPETNSEKGVSE